ncbi:MAG: hypothetical protein H7096_06500, partial [Flavobacterium sp.]|nr:hypothetical protein [Pedobacter sp.]
GRFKFENLVFADTSKVMIQAQTKKGNRNVIIEINESYTELKIKPSRYKADINSGISMLAYAENNRKQYGEQRKDAIQLKEVKVTATKIVQKHSSNRAGIGNADVVITSEILARRAGSLSQRLIGSGKLGRSIGHIHGMRLILDGASMNYPFSIDDINPSDVSSVEILHTAGTLGVYGGVMAGNYGIIIINSKRWDEYRDDNTNNYVAGMVISKIRGYYPASQFYIPKYSGSYENHNDDDFRSTILWQPDLITDSDGRGIINFFYATTPGSYRVIIEGLDTEGNIGREVYRYTVQEE